VFWHADSPMSRCCSGIHWLAIHIYYCFHKTFAHNNQFATLLWFALQTIRSALNDIVLAASRLHWGLVLISSFSHLCDIISSSYVLRWDGTTFNSFTFLSVLVADLWRLWCRSVLHDCRHVVWHYILYWQFKVDMLKWNKTYRWLFFSSFTLNGCSVGFSILLLC